MRTTSLTFALLLSCCSVVKSELVIDAFDQGRGLSNGTQLNNGVPLGSTATDALNQGIAGTRTATITGGGTNWREGGYINSPSNFLNVANPHQSVLRNTSGAGTLTLDYLFASDFDFTNTGQYVLNLDMFGNVTPASTWSYTVTIADGATSASVGGSLQGPITLRAGDFGVVGMGIASTIDRISVFVSGPNGGILDRSNAGTGARIYANPEPASLCLLGLTGVAGATFARRRKKSSEIA